MFFRVVCSEGGQDPQGQKESSKVLENSGVFHAFLAPLKGISSVASRSQESEKHCLENTVWKSGFCHHDFMKVSVEWDVSVRECPSSS